MIGPTTGSPSRPIVSDDDCARALRGFGPIGITTAVVILVGNAVFVPLSALSW